jgi:elongation factor Tu
MPAFRFTDVMEKAGDKSIVIRAHLRVISTEQGGRETPFTDGWRPNHNFGGADNRIFYIGQVEIGEGRWVSPGHECDAVIRFFNVRGLDELLTVGRTWRIQEGPRLVAIGEILEKLGDA